MKGTSDDSKHGLHWIGLEWGYGGENTIIYFKWKIHRSGEWHFILGPWQRLTVLFASQLCNGCFKNAMFYFLEFAVCHLCPGACRGRVCPCSAEDGHPVTGDWRGCHISQPRCGGCTLYSGLYTVQPLYTGLGSPWLIVLISQVSLWTVDSVGTGPGSRHYLNYLQSEQWGQRAVSLYLILPLQQ